jgi:hypothetical protein
MNLTQQDLELIKAGLDALLRATGVNNCVPVAALLCKFSQPVEGPKNDTESDVPVDTEQ